MTTNKKVRQLTAIEKLDAFFNKIRRDSQGLPWVNWNHVLPYLIDKKTRCIEPSKLQDQGLRMMRRFNPGLLTFVCIQANYRKLWAKKIPPAKHDITFAQGAAFCYRILCEAARSKRLRDSNDHNT